MENNDFLNKNIENLISSHGEEQKMDEEQKKKIIENLTNKDTQAQVTSQSHSQIWRKIAIAALVVLIPAVIVIYLIMPSEQKIVIPPELAAMSIEELITLNYDSSQNTFDSNIVKYALKQALKKTAPEEVVQVAKSLNDNSMKMSASRVALPAHPIAELAGDNRKIFSEVVEESNVFIHARLLSCKLNVDDLITAIVEKEIFGKLEDYMSKYKVTIQLFVIDSLPKNVFRREQIITTQTVLYENQLNAIKENSDYYFTMMQDKEPRFLEYFSGVYPVDFNSPANIEMWQFFKDAQDILLWGQSPKPETIEYWISRLKDDTFLLALEYMDILPDDLLPAESIMDAIEQRYSDYILYTENSNEEMAKTVDQDKRIKISNEAYNLKHNNIQLFEKTMTILLRSGDKESVSRMLSLVDEDIVDIENGIIMGRYGFNSRQFVPLILRMIIASEENSFSGDFVESYIKYKNSQFVVANYGRGSESNDIQPAFLHDLTMELLNQAAKMPVKDVQAMLVSIFDNPPEFGLYVAEDFKRFWMLLSSSEIYDMRSYLEKFLLEPNLSDINVRQETNGVRLGLSVFSFEQAAFDVLRMLPLSARPGHEELVNLLLLIYERNKGNQKCITFTINTFEDILRPADTECVTVFKEILSVDRPNWVIPQIITQRMPSPALVPDIMSAIDNKKFENEASLIGALYACGEKDEAIEMALEMLGEPPREDNSRNLYQDISRNAALILILGKTQRTDLLSVIEEYTRKEYAEKYRGTYTDIGGRLVDFNLDELMQNAIMAFARLGGKSSIPRLREIYKTTDDIRVKIVSAIGLYYNGDKTGEKILRHFADGTYRSVPDIAIRWGHDISDGTVFQDIIKSYLRNELTDALWLEKLKYCLDRADTDTDSDFFRDYRNEILHFIVEHLDNKDRTVRGYACEILQKATGKNFGFDSVRYSGQQADIVQQWREYIKSIEE